MAIDSEYKIAVLTGKPGEDGYNLKLQYSKDNSSWHTTFASGDLYMRTSSDNGATWSAGMRIVGEKGDTGAQGPQGIQGIQGNTGQRGGRDLSITTAPSAYTTKVGTFTPAYRISLSTVKTQSGIDTVYTGDTLVYGVYRYPIGYVDTSYVYTATRTSVKGDTGSQGIQGIQGIQGPQGIQGIQGERGFSSRTIAYRVNYNSFSSASNGEIYVSGYNSEGKQADTVGYVIVNGTTHYVKGALNQNCCTDGYMIAEIGGTTDAPKAPKYCVRTWDGKWMMGAGSAATGWTDITSTIANYIVLGQMRSYATEGAITFEEQTPVLLSSINFKAWDYSYSGIVGSTTDYTSATITPFIFTQNDDGTFTKANGSTKSARRGNFVICLNATTPTATTAVPVIKVWNGTWWETMPDTNPNYRNCQAMTAGDLPTLAGYYDTLGLDVPPICGTYIKTLTANKAFINELFANDIVVGNKIRSSNFEKVQQNIEILWKQADGTWSSSPYGPEYNNGRPTPYRDLSLRITDVSGTTEITYSNYEDLFFCASDTRKPDDGWIRFSRPGDISLVAVAGYNTKNYFLIKKEFRYITNKDTFYTFAKGTRIEGFCMRKDGILECNEAKLNNAEVSGSITLNSTDSLKFMNGSSIKNIKVEGTTLTLEVD